MFDSIEQINIVKQDRDSAGVATRLVVELQVIR